MLNHNLKKCRDIFKNTFNKRVLGFNKSIEIKNTFFLHSLLLSHYTLTCCVTLGN